MTWLSGTALVAAGIVLAIRLLAAWYSVVDLWYAIRTAWPAVLARVVGWSGATVAALAVLSGRARWWLLAGMACYVVVFVSVYAVIVSTGARKTKPTPVVE
jgi:hypothetical protein